MKKIEVLKRIFLIGILTFSLLPIRISASTFDSSNIVGTYAEILSYTSIEPDIQTVSGDRYCNADFLVEVHVVLDDYYIGEIVGDLRFSYYTFTISNNTATRTLNTYNYNNATYYVNGSEFTYTFNLRTMIQINSNIQNPILSSNMLFTVDSASVSVVPDNSRGFFIPFESLNFYYQLFYNGTFDSLDYTLPCYNTNLPIYFIPADSVVYSGLTNNTSNANFNRSLTFVVATDLTISNTTSLASSFQIDTSIFKVSGMKIISYSTLNLDNYSKPIRIIKFDVMPKTATSQTVKLKPNVDCYLTPIFAGYTYSYYVSTDFALQFGLTNSLLDNVDAIAQGTSQSQNSSSAADSENASFSQSASDLYNQENDFITDFQNNLVSPSFDVNTSFGSNFLTSATWVRDQFNNVVNNTPFASLLTFSLTLGVGLLIIGKVFNK